MKGKELAKILALLAVLLLVANIMLLALKIITELLFWAVIIAIGLFAYALLPKLK